MNLEVSTASKFLQKSSKAPATVSIISADDIKRYGYRNLTDALRVCAGFTSLMTVTIATSVPVVSAARAITTPVFYCWWMATA